MSDQTPAQPDSFDVETELDNDATLITVSATGSKPPEYISITIGVDREPKPIDVEQAVDAAATALIGIRKELGHGATP